jgi:hypothetical protein
MYNKFINPLKVRLLRKQISPEEALKELQAMTDDERYPVQLRACILDELASIEPSSTAKDSAREALRAALRQPSEELRRDATAKILDRIMASPAVKDYHASKRHSERKGDSANRRQKSRPEFGPSPGEDETKSTIEIPAVGVPGAESTGPPLRSDSTSDAGLYSERRDAYSNAAYRRRLGRDNFGAHRQEELLDDARAWAEAQLRERASEGSDAVELKNRVVKDTWDRFIPTHRYHSDFKLGYREFASALWEEGLQSLADLAIAAIQARVASAPKAAALPPNSTDRSDRIETTNSELRGPVFSLGRGIHTPTVAPTRVFPETRHSLPDAPEDLKQEFRLLAQEAIILATRGSSNPLRGVDDWLDRLRIEGDYSEGDMELLLCASRDNLRKTRVYELGIEHDEQAERCGSLALRFESLRVQFFKSPDEGQGAIGQKEPSNIGQPVKANDRKLNKEKPVQIFPGQEYPKYMHHATKEPVIVNSEREQAGLGPEWSETYIHQAYPAYRRHWTKKEVIVKDAAEDEKLGGGWADSTSAFDLYRGPRPPKTEVQDPVKWVDEWSVPDLSSKDRNKIKAQLLRADSAFWESPDADSADLGAMKLAFDGIAKVLFEAGILKEHVLQKEIPALVWDSAIAGGWYRFASETPGRIFPERLGHYHVWRDETKDWQGLFRAETAKWLAELLEASAQAPAKADTPVRTDSSATGSQSGPATVTPEPGQSPEVIPASTTQPDDTGTNAIPKSDDDSAFDFTTEEGRGEAIGRYTKHWRKDSRQCSEASLARTAVVNPADLSKWKKGLLPPGSEKARRIENALKENKPPTRAARANGDE